MEQLAVAAAEDPREDLIERERQTWFYEASEAEFEFSVYANLLRAMTDAAHEHAISTGAKWGKYQSEVFLPAARVVRSLHSALTDYLPQDTPRDPNFWRHDDLPLTSIRKQRPPAMHRKEVEETVERYLRLPYRCRAMERTLVDVLVALELYAFADEMYHHEAADVRSGPILRRWHPLAKFAIYRAISLAIVLVLCGGVELAGSLGWPPYDWKSGIQVVLLLLFVLESIWSIFVLPVAWRDQNRLRKRVLDMLGAMSEVYSALRGAGPISTRHVEERAKRAADNGVVWPASLFALLDDINAREGRI